jgi:hypothetical protein
VVDQDRVAVGLGVLHLLGPEDAAGARPVLDDHGLAERLAHRLAEHARDRVGRTAGGEGDDHGDVASRVLLGCGASGERERKRSAEHANG